jgi:hypothetical protein
MLFAQPGTRGANSKTSKPAIITELVTEKRAAISICYSRLVQDLYQGYAANFFTVKIYLDSVIIEFYFV